MLNDILGALGSKLDLGNLDLAGLAQQLGGQGLIGDVLGQLQQGGLAEVVQSWVSNGANLPVSLEQLQSALGPDMVNQLAGSLGIDPAQLGDVLPGVVDQLSQGGQLPQAIAEAAPNLLGQDGLGKLLGGLFR
ncbi:YidB family protein [Asticcacaulis sp.]|uniref:YidB family protein n=1 Tax=Asticcacaulis sp. TaxID=1872648 RepID=UPI0026045190|nr:YidB family protein [Asticcacaulis sp.]